MTEQTVKLISKSIPEVNGKQLTAKEYIAYVARISSDREDKTAESQKLIKYLIKNKHWSPFEHFFLTFEIRTTRAIGRQLLRHRSLNFQEWSQRFNDPDLEFYVPELRAQHTDWKQCSTEEIIEDEKLREKLISEIKDSYNKSALLYQKLLNAGVAKEQARFILPEATYTTMIITGNLRNWIHFIQIREDAHAQKEIREIATEIRKQIESFYDFDFE